MSANALDALSMGLTRLVGPALGGAVMGLLGLSGVVVLDAASFLVSAILISLIAVPSSTGRREAERAVSVIGIGDGTITAVWRDWLDGLRLVAAQRFLAVLFGVIGVVMVAYGIISVLLVVFVKDVLHGGAVELGWIASAQGIGSLVGTLGLGRVGRTSQPVRYLSWGLIATGLAFLAAFHATDLWLALGFFALAGAGVASWMVSQRTLLQCSVADRYRGRVFGTHDTANAVLQLLGMGLAGGLGGGDGVRSLLSIAGLLYATSGIAALVLMRPSGEARATDSTIVP
jgi:Na+/melibiose symporter-like transporter